MHRDDQQHGRHAGPVDLRPVGAEQVPQVAAARDQPGDEQHDAPADDRDRAMICQSGPARRLALGDVGAGEHAAQRGQILGVMLLQVGHAERR